MNFMRYSDKEDWDRFSDYPNSRMHPEELHRVICIYDAVYCPVCDCKQPHVELMHWTGINTTHPVDAHRRRTTLHCLHHCDTELVPEEVIGAGLFFDEYTDRWYHVQFRHKAVGPVACNQLLNAKTSTDAYYFDYSTSKDKAGRQDANGSGCGPAYDLVDRFPFFGTEAQKTLYTVETLREYLCTEPRRRKGIVTGPAQLEMF